MKKKQLSSITFILILSIFVFFSNCSATGRINWDDFDKKIEEEKRSLIIQEREKIRNAEIDKKNDSLSFYSQSPDKSVDEEARGYALDDKIIFKIAGILIGLSLGSIAGSIGLFRYNRKKGILTRDMNKEKVYIKNFSTRYLGEILTVVGFGVFFYNILRCLENASRFSILSASLGIMMAISGFFIFINKIVSKKGGIK